MEKQYPKKLVLSLCICLLICFVSMIGSHLLLTNGGTVSMRTLMLDLPTGETIRVIEYRPAAASPETPVPAIVFSHGNDNTAETYQNYALELSRRGFAVFAPDITSAGASTPVQSNDTVGYGIYDTVDYIYENLDYIDSSRIGIAGYSKGGVNVMDCMDAYGEEQRNAPDSYVQRVSSAFIMAPMWRSMEGFATGVNVGLDIGLYDPYSRMSFADVEGYFPGDLTVKAEVKEFVNYGVPGTFSQEELSDSSVKVELGRVYGDYASGTGRVVYNAAGSTHGLGSVSSDFIRECTQFFMDTLQAPNPIPAEQQIWKWNFVLSAAGLLSVFAMTVPLAGLLLRCTIFKPLAQPVPEARSELRTRKDKMIFAIISLCIAFLSPLIAPKMFTLPNTLFHIDDHAGTSRWFLLGGMANSLLCWTVAFALINLTVFFIFYFAIHRRNGLSMRDFGVPISLKNAGRTVILAATVFTICYLVTCFAGYAFQVGFRLVDMTFYVTPLYKIGLCLRYLPFYLFFWCVNSLIMNGCNRFKGMSGKKNLILCIGCNIIGIVTVAVIYYIKLYVTGTGFGAPSAWKAYMAMVYMALTLTMGTVINRKIYNMSGSIYLGPVIYATLLTFVTHSIYMIPDYLY